MSSDIDYRFGRFRLETLKQHLLKAKSFGYRVTTCAEWAKEAGHGRRQERCIVLRIDVDHPPERLPALLSVLDECDVKGSIFVRLHGEYNPFSFQNYKVLKSAIQRGYELGYHSEVIDQAAIWCEDEADCLTRDLTVLTAMFDYKVVGIASHGGRTGLNNLNFWENHSPADFGLLYEAYDTEPSFDLFRQSLYLSDSEWVRWKCYRYGKLIPGDYRDLGEHLDEHPNLIYLLIHPETFFHEHPYE